MKLSAAVLALFATVSVAAADPAPAVPAKPVDPLTLAIIREQSVARAPENQKEQTPDPEVLDLPKMTVKQQPRPRPRLGDHVILGPKAFNDELARKNLSALDRGGLNRFTLPSWMGGVSAAERAREDYNLEQKRQFMSDVLTIAKAAELTDPAAAQALREAAAKP